MRFILQFDSGHTTAIICKEKNMVKENKCTNNDNCSISDVLNQLFNKATAI